MLQIPTEEVLVAFRDKYHAEGNSLVSPTTEKKHISFPRIVAIQAAAAVILFIIAVAAKLLNFEVYRHIANLFGL